MPNYSTAAESIAKGRSTVTLKTRNPKLQVPDKNLNKSISIASLASSVQAAPAGDQVKDAIKTSDLADINEVNQVSLNVS